MSNLFSSIKKGLIDIFLKKAYTEGVYADTPANRKLGRVGMTYAAYASQHSEEIAKKKVAQEKDKSKNLPLIKEKISNLISKFEKTNDIINVETKEGVSIRLERKESKEGNHFSKAIVKKGDKVRTFDFKAKEDLVNSLANYIYQEKLTLNDEEIKREKVNLKDNYNVIHNAMQMAVDKNVGVLTIKGSGGTTIYLARRKASWHLKEFSSYSIRDSKKNIIADYRLKEQEDKVISKLEADLEKFGISLQGNKKEYVKKEEKPKEKKIERKEKSKEEEKEVEIKKIRKGDFEGQNLSDEQIKEYGAQKAMSTSNWDLFDMSTPKLIRANYPIDVLVSAETTITSDDKVNLIVKIKEGSSYGDKAREEIYEGNCSNLKNIKKKIGKSFAAYLESSPKAKERFKEYLIKK